MELVKKKRRGTHTEGKNNTPGDQKSTESADLEGNLGKKKISGLSKRPQKSSKSRGKSQGDKSVGNSRDE